MPVYGPLIIGDEQFAEEAHTEQVLGSNVYGPLVVGDVSAAAVVAEKIMAPPAPELTLEQEILQAQVAGATERMAALLGDAYTVSEAEQGLLAHPDIWADLALAEYGRAATAGARKGLVKSLLAHESGSDELKALLGAL